VLFPALDRLNKPREINAQTLKEAICVSPCVLMFRREDIKKISDHWWWGFVVETAHKKFRYLNVPSEAMKANENRVREYVQYGNEST
jgi:hypothetical protein